MTRSFSRTGSLMALRIGAAAAVAAALSGCYVVPMQQPIGQSVPPQQAIAVLPAGPVAQTFTARLYPSNAEAAQFGAVTGVVTNDMNGRGHFSAIIGGEQFQGEATRVAGAQRGGIANASGTRGGVLACRYTMNSATLGSDSCVLNSGPAFAMHVGG